MKIIVSENMDILILAPTAIIVFILGTAVGSFINVVVYRVPAGLSILFPPSRCPHCLHQLKSYDNVPVLGWILLKGRCRYCRSKISQRYPIVEAVTGILFLVLFLVFKVSILSLGYCFFCSWLLALSLIDLDTMTLPNPLTKSGLVAGIIFQMTVGYFTTNSWVGLAHHLAGAIGSVALGIWLFDIISVLGRVIFQKDAMGSGDAKLAAMMGAWLGWKYLLLAAFIACVIGAFFGGAAMVLARQQWGQKMPFGPFLALGSVFTVLGGEAMLSAYIRLFFPSL